MQHIDGNMIRHKKRMLLFTLENPSGQFQCPSCKFIYKPFRNRNGDSIVKEQYVLEQWDHICKYGRCEWCTNVIVSKAHDN